MGERLDALWVKCEVVEKRQVIQLWHQIRMLVRNVFLNERGSLEQFGTGSATELALIFLPDVRFDSLCQFVVIIFATIFDRVNASSVD